MVFYLQGRNYFPKLNKTRSGKTLCVFTFLLQQERNVAQNITQDNTETAVVISWF